MPIIRKLTTVGSSKGITLPKSWIENAEQEHKAKMISVALEVNGCILIKPIFKMETKK